MIWKPFLRHFKIRTAITASCSDFVLDVCIIRLLYKVIISDNILWLYEIKVTFMKVLDKILTILVLTNIPKAKTGVRSILKNVSDIAEVLRFEVPGPLKGISINQYCST